MPCVLFPHAHRHSATQRALSWGSTTVDALYSLAKHRCYSTTKVTFASSDLVLCNAMLPSSRMSCRNGLLRALKHVVVGVNRRVDPCVLGISAVTVPRAALLPVVSCACAAAALGAAVVAENSEHEHESTGCDHSAACCGTAVELPQLESLVHQAALDWLAVRDHSHKRAMLLPKLDCCVVSFVVLCRLTIGRTRH